MALQKPGGEARLTIRADKIFLYPREKESVLHAA
jgi:hypothetical protein